jgi:hypothetical protein
LVFDHVLLRDVVRELIRAYGVDIRIADMALAVQPVGIDVSVSEQRIGDVLALLGEVTRSHYTYDGKMYVIVPGPRGVPHGPSEPRRRGFPQLEKMYGK